MSNKNKESKVKKMVEVSETWLDPEAETVMPKHLKVVKDKEVKSEEVEK